MYKKGRFKKWCSFRHGYGHLNLKGTLFHILVANSFPLMVMGYRFKRKISAREGILFIFSKQKVHPISMLCVRIPLDILWLEEDFAITHMVSAHPPSFSSPRFIHKPSKKSLYVLELPHGTISKYRLSTGDVLDIHIVSF